MELSDLPGSDAWIYLAATGGGAGAQDLLWSVPGASAFLAGACFPYSRHELVKLIGYSPTQSVNEETAVNMAVAAYMRACVSCPADRQPVGVGCTASVATLREHRGDHRSWIAVISGHDRVWLESQTYEKVGPKGRVADGAMVDLQIVDTVLRVVAGEGTCHSDDLWALVGARPLFGVDGSRCVDAPPGATLMPGAFDPIHDGHLDVSTRDTIFQISMRTPHKPDVSITEALRRAAKINASGRAALIEYQASTFLAKARKWPGSTFIIGSDTLERVLDPKYGHPVDPMLAEFNELGAWFAVAQREGSPYYRDLIAKVPEQLAGMFRLLPPSEHAGLSSTQLRKEIELCKNPST